MPIKSMLVLLLSFSLLSVSCKEDQSSQEQSQTQQPTEVQLVDVQKVNQLAEVNKELVILDVRTPEEYQDGHLNHAENIDFHTGFDSKLQELDKSKTYLVYCQKGGRSHNAAEKMAQAGFQHVYDMEGGYINWTAAGLPTKK